MRMEKRTFFGRQGGLDHGRATTVLWFEWFWDGHDGGQRGVRLFDHMRGAIQLPELQLPGSLVKVKQSRSPY
jgi:hypothetical protein